MITSAKDNENHQNITLQQDQRKTFDNSYTTVRQTQTQQQCQTPFIVVSSDTAHTHADIDRRLNMSLLPFPRSEEAVPSKLGIRQRTVS